MQEQLVALLGHPVTHSKSPNIHNAAFQALKLPYHYMAFDVLPDQLETAVTGLKAVGFRGGNVTIPHKITIVSIVDELTPLARAIGAVNTLYYENGTLIGDNTDGKGYVASLLEQFPNLNLNEMTIGIVGAGGAARAVAFTLTQYGVRKLYITNRSFNKAYELAYDLSTWGEAIAVPLEEWNQFMPLMDLLIQATSVGMSPNVTESVVIVEDYKPNLILSDLIYNPLETKLLLEAKKKGLRVHTGMGMLVHQGALAFEGWTGKKAPIELMKNILRNSIMP